MERVRLVIVALAVACVAFLPASSGAQVRALTLQDRADIQDLYTRYNYTIDAHSENGYAWAETFTADGLFLNGPTRLEGREQLAEFARLKPTTMGVGVPHHFITNLRLEPIAGGVRGNCYYQFIALSEKDQSPVILRMGTYEDVIVRTPKGWRFKTRTFNLSAMPREAAAQANARP